MKKLHTSPTFFCTLYHGFEDDDVSLFSTYVYSFKPFIPCDMYIGWLSIPDFICQDAFGTNVYYGLWTFYLFFHVDVVVVRLRIN